MGQAKYMRDLKHFAEKAVPPGAVIDLTYTHGGHVAIGVKYCNRRRVVYAPATPSDRRSLLNVKRDLRRIAKDMEQ